MRTTQKRPSTAADPIKEIRRMPKRLMTLGALIGAATTLLALLPVASASAASPWWQVLDGSHPTNMWEPESESEVQEVEGEKAFGLVLAAKIEVGGEVVGCLGAGEIPGFRTADEICEEGTGFPADETAAELQSTLEAAYGGIVEVSGGPAATSPFNVTTPGRWVEPLQLTPLTLFEVNVGTVRTKVLTKDSGRLLITVTNLGDAPVDATETPVRIVDKLPEGITAWGTKATAGFQEVNGPVSCSIEAPDEVVCTFEDVLPSYEAITVEISTVLTGSPPVEGAPGEISVSGGDAPSVKSPQRVKFSPEPTPFGVERFAAQAEEEGGVPAKQAGVHPFQYTTTIQFNSGAPAIDTNGREFVEQPALPRNLRFPLPPGLIGNATVMPQCTMAQFTRGKELINECPDDAVVGVSSVTVVERSNLGFIREAVPVFNLTPAHGEPARFGFLAAGVPVVLDTSVDSHREYRITAEVHNVIQLAEFLSATTTLWGTPGDPRHDSARGWSCVYWGKTLIPLDPCERPTELSETAFLRMPVQCATPLSYGVEVEPWNVPIGALVDSASWQSEDLRGCNRVPLNPSVSGAPTSKLAENPSGFDFKLTMPNAGLFNKESIAEGQPKKVEVELPDGVTINPSAGEGLAVCAPAEYAEERFDSKPGEGCPEASKIGSVKIATPLLDEEATGALYQAAPFENPSNSLLGLYLVAKIPDRGILVKQAGRVEPDPQTGKLVTTFDNLPQLPFSSFELHFREGGRAPLVTPPACGTFETVAKFTPWSASDPNNPAPNEIVTRTSSFTIQRGVDGGACPTGGLPPFKPNLLAGTRNNAAGSFSPFDLRLTRTDGEQEFTHFSIKLPPGVVGKLAGIPFCPDAAIAAAKARTGPHGGAEELASPSCPAASEVGHTLVGSGVGSVLTYVPGKVYLAGPYHGSPLSIAAITAAKVGPFDLGTVVVREALRINPETAEVFADATGSDPIPHIIQGIPVHARDIRVYVDRPNFVLNPTSCERTSTASTVLGSGLDFSSEADDNPLTVTSPFQAADCASLGFKPRLTLKLRGKTRRGGNPALRAVLRPRAGDANPTRISVALPHSEFLDQGHIDTVCTRVQFNAGTGNGAECPSGAIYGHAKAWTPLFSEPLEGPIFLRSSEHPLPDLVLALHGLVDVDAVGRIDSVNGGIRNTFDFVPDAPVSKVVLDLPGGKKSLLENSTNICSGNHRAVVKMEGHNGRLHNFSTPLKASCGKAARKQARPGRG